ncbi:MAG: hemolysin family protein [Acidimicrobiia bacterium]
MSSADIWMAAVAVVLFCCSIVLAMAETAFLRMGRIRALALEDEGRKGAARLSKMLEHPERTMNSLLLMLLVSQLTVASFVGVLTESRFGGWGVAIGIFLQIVLFFVVGEVAPKTFAVQHTDRVALRLSGLLWVLTNFWPLRMLSRGLIGLANIVLPGRGLKRGPFITEEEIRTMADVAADEAVIEREERRLIHSIFEFGDTVVREVMQPRTDMIAVPSDIAVDPAIQQAIDGGFSRLPVYEGTNDNIIGILFLKDLIRAARSGEGATSARRWMRPAVFVPEAKRVAELLSEMQRDRFHMAIVIDEYGGTAGLVTLEDLLEEIVGEITDEYDLLEPQLEQLADGRLRVPGRMSVDDVSEQLDLELPNEEWDTMSGLVFGLLGHVPSQGESVSYKNLEFTADRVQGRRIVSVVVTKHPEDVEESEPAHSAGTSES